MDAKAPHLLKFAIDVGPTIHAAIRLLQEAHEYSQDVGLPVWQFAVEIQRLRDAGVTNSDLRCLLCKGYVEHAVEITSSSHTERSFLPCRVLALSSDTCFIPTDDGMRMARQLASSHPAVESNGCHLRKRDNGVATSTKVMWSPQRRELTVGGVVVKQFRVPAPNQQLVLEARSFEFVKTIGTPVGYGMCPGRTPHG